IAILGFVSCTNEVEQDYVLNNLHKPVITITSDQTSLTELDNSGTEDTDESVATFTVTADRAFNTDMKFKVELMPNESSATIEDFIISLDESPIDAGSEGFLIVLPRNESSMTFTIAAAFDSEFEGTETLKFIVYPIMDLNGVVNPNSQTINLTISNSVDPALSLVFDWEKTFTFDGIEYSFCDLAYDVDILVYDANGDMFGPGAQTGDCPESLQMSTEDYPDGTYMITAYLYDDGPDDIASAGIAPAIDIPINVSYVRQGSATLGQEGMFTQTAGFTTDSPVGTEIYVATVIVSGGVFTIQNNGTTIASGRHTKLKHVE
ncbi:MAG TPA: hypothetical protein VGB43_07065, partial [Flavobacterium sp.]